MGSTNARSIFATYNNPQKHGYAKGIEDLNERARVTCEQLCSEFCVTPTRVGAWAYCVKRYVGHYPVFDENGKYITDRLAITDEEKALVPPDLEHVHMVLEDESPMSFTSIKNTYAAGAHFEITRGTRKQAEDYISKTGEYAHETKKENGKPYEEIIYVKRQGDIRGRQGKRSDLDEINSYITQGLKPAEILARDPKYYRNEKLIQRMYVDKKAKETEFARKVEVYWHMGESGSGKSFYRSELIKKYGADDVFYVTNFDDKSRFDNYMAQKVLWLEDFKGEMTYGDFLRITDVYQAVFNARYQVARGLWTEIHITSIYHPKAIFNKMVKEMDRDQDGIQQFRRRITAIIYHYKVTEDGEDKYKSCAFPFDTTIAEIQATIQAYEKDRAWKKADFVQLNVEGGEQLPF